MAAAFITSVITTSTTPAAAAGFVLVIMTLAMNGLAIWLRYRLRKNIKW